MEGKRILVADDEPYILNSLKLVLEEAGYEILIARDGEQTLSLAMNEPLDLIILDIRMPKLSGHEVHQHLKKNTRTKDLPVIILTAIGQEIPEAEGWELDSVDYITKPFSPYAMVEKVNQILGT
jgi:DNA-binding response OmpR family regulator